MTCLGTNLPRPGNPKFSKHKTHFGYDTSCLPTNALMSLLFFSGLDKLIDISKLSFEFHKIFLSTLVF